MARAERKKTPTLRSVIRSATERELQKMVEPKSGQIDGWKPNNLASWIWQGIAADVTLFLAAPPPPPPKPRIRK